MCFQDSPSLTQGHQDELKLDSAGTDLALGKWPGGCLEEAGRERQARQGYQRRETWGRKNRTYGGGQRETVAVPGWGGRAHSGDISKSGPRMLGVPKYVSQEEYTIGCTERGCLREPLRRSQEAVAWLFWSRDVGPWRARRGRSPGGECQGWGCRTAEKNTGHPGTCKFQTNNKWCFNIM